MYTTCTTNTVSTVLFSSINRMAELNVTNVQMYVRVAMCQTHAEANILTRRF